MKERLLSLNRSPGPNKAVLVAHEAHPIKVMNIIDNRTNFATALFKIIFFPLQSNYKEKSQTAWLFIIRGWIVGTQNK